MRPPHLTPPQTHQVSYATFNVPTLSAAAISRIKSKAVSAAPRALRQKYTHTRAVNPTSGFLHPGGFAGPEQLAAMESRLAANVQPQVTARDSLLTVGDACWFRWQVPVAHTYSCLWIIITPCTILAYGVKAMMRPQGVSGFRHGASCPLSVCFCGLTRPQTPGGLTLH